MRAAIAAGVGMIVGVGAGCGGGGTLREAPPIVVAPPTGAAPPGYCMAIEHGRVLAQLTADDQTATVCTDISLEAFAEQQEHGVKLGGVPVSLRCGAVDLATGGWQQAAPPPRQPAGSEADRGPLDVKQDATGVQLCAASACTPLAVPPPQGKPDEYAVQVDDSGRYALVAGRSLSGIWFFDAKTGQKIGALALDEHTCVEDVEFLGDLVYVGYGPPTSSHPCEGPSDQGVLYRATGQAINTLPGLRPGEVSAVALGGGRYAISDRAGAAVAIVDARTAKVITVHLPRVPCKDCSPLGPPDDWYATRTAAPSRGKLIAVSPAVLAVIDPVTGAIEKQIRYPVCPKR